LRACTWRRLNESERRRAVGSTPTLGRHFAHRTLLANQLEVAAAFVGIGPETGVGDAAPDRLFLGAAEQTLEAAVHGEIGVGFQIDERHTIRRGFEGSRETRLGLDAGSFAAALLRDVASERDQTRRARDFERLAVASARSTCRPRDCAC
jgi:hypothetical protein